MAVTALTRELAAEALANDEENGWSRETVSVIPELRNPEMLKPFAHAYLSNSSLSIKDNRTRKIVGSKVAHGEVARLYLKRLMSEALEAGGPKMLAKKVPYRREALQFEDRRPAYFFGGQCGGPFELVDIKACYASLYTRLTLDVTYRPDTDPPLLGLGKGAFPRADEWVKSKAPRNALWGNLLNKTGREWRHGEPIDDAYPNKYFAPDLAGIVLDACHAIAREAKETFGALSWAVDGGAFRPGQGQAFSNWLFETWGLTAEIRAEGAGWLFGATSYSVGEVTTLDVRKGMAHEWPAMNAVRNQTNFQRAWLADVFLGRAA